MQAVPSQKAELDAGDQPGIPVDNRWLLFVLQLPARPSNARVKTWRRLQQLGAIPVKNAVYVLPNSAQALEDFSWLREEVESLRGQAAVFSASLIEDLDEADIIEQFRAARASDYEEILNSTRRLKPRPRGARTRPSSKEVRALRDQFEHVKAIDFFSAPGAADAEAAVEALERDLRRQPGPVTPRSTNTIDPRIYQQRTWVTRPRPGADRFACAWLIQRFIDPKATFAFANDPASMPDAVPFDMYDEGFSHEGARCTFEVLTLRFAIDDPGIRRLAEIVHDVDLKDDRYRAPQAPTVAMLVEGLRATFVDDVELLGHGVGLFEALYRGLLPSDAHPRRRQKRGRPG